MVKSGIGKVVNRGMKYPKIFVYIPMDVFKDSTFPFKTDEHVTVEIVGDSLVIRKEKKR